MIFNFYKSLFLFIFIIPSFLFSACSDEPEHTYISSSPKVWLGIKAKNITERRLENLKLDFGLEVTKVYINSPAEKAGLREEDILLKINGVPLENVDKMIDLVKNTEINDKVSITYLREGKEEETEAIMSERKRNSFVWRDQHKNFDYFVSDSKSAWLGVSTEELTDQLRQYFHVPEYLGVLVKEVVKESPAEKFGLKAGDVIIQIGKKEIEDSRDLFKAINRYEPGEEVDVKIVRDKNEMILKVTLDEGKGRFHQHFSFNPDRIDIDVPEFEIEIPEIDIDLEELHDLNEKMQDEFEKHSDELDKLKEELEKIKIQPKHRNSIVI